MLSRAKGASWLLLLALSIAGGCDPHRVVKRRFSNEFGCREQPKVRDIGGGAVRVTGCGHRASYLCVADKCSREYTRDDQLEARTTYLPPAARTSTRGHGWSEVKVGRTKGGARVLRAKIASRVMSLHLQAVPGQDNAMVLVGLQVRNRGTPHQDCALRLMVDGRLLEMGETGYRHDKGFEELRSAMSYDDLFAMANASRVLGRVCEDEFRIGQERLRTIQELVLRIKEELAWQEEAAAGQTVEPASPADAGADATAVEGAEVL